MRTIAVFIYGILCHFETSYILSYLQYKDKIQTVNSTQKCNLNKCNLNITSHFLEY